MTPQQAVVGNIRMRISFRKEVANNEVRFDARSYTEDAEQAFDIALSAIDNYDDPNEKVFAIQFEEFEELTEPQVQAMVKQATKTYGIVEFDYTTVIVQLQTPQANEFSNYLHEHGIEHDIVDMTVYPT